MKSWIVASDLVQKKMNKVKFSGNCNKNQTKKKSKGVPLVINFHTLLKNFAFFIHGPRSSKSFYVWTHDHFRSVRKLSSYLVKAKL